MNRSLLPCRMVPVLLVLLLINGASWGQSFPRGKAQAILTIHREPTAAEMKRNYTGAKYEPMFGCFLGAFVDFDSTLRQPIKFKNHGTHQDPTGFEIATDRVHASYFFYMGYGRPLPLDYVKWLAERGKFVHVALEPYSGLEKVKDDAYLHKLADDMARSGARIFLRFASEMNGDWVEYGKKPKLYREKFRLVYNVMRKRAPNVALVWCPYEEPISNIASFYPGDDATDWVGVNLYNVTYHNNSINSPSEHEHPVDLLNYVYQRYSARKPIMVCEYGASHHAQCEGRPRPDFAARKIMTLYNALPRIFPRVKSIHYFDANNMQFVPARPYNDYSVTDDPTVLAAYKFAVASPWFLSGWQDPKTARSVPIPIPMRSGEVLQGTVRLSCWARAPSDILTVRYKVDGHSIYTASSPGQWECLWDAGSVAPGKHTLTLVVTNAAGKVAATQSLPIVTRR